MFTFRVSSLNYAPWCSVVSVPGLIWMFVRKSEGWKKRSQTGNPAPLMSPQKWHFCPEFITRHYAWQVIWYAPNADVKSIFEALARLLHTELELLIQVDQAFESDTVYMCLRCPPKIEERFQWKGRGRALNYGGKWCKALIESSGATHYSIGHKRSGYTICFSFLLPYFMIVWPSRTGTTETDI